jgi:Tol biopolymer transport system component
MRVALAVAVAAVALATSGSAAAAGGLMLVSANQLGQLGTGASSGRPAMSADGRYVAFFSSATNLVANDVNGATFDAFVVDRATGAVELADIGSDGQQAPNGTGGLVSDLGMSSDGRYVVFLSSSRLVPGMALNFNSHAYVRDLVNGTTTAVALDCAGLPAATSVYAVTISGDGRYVAFVARIDPTCGLPSDTGFGNLGVFVRDLQTATTQLITDPARDAAGNGSTTALSGDGDIVLWDTYEYDRRTGNTVRVPGPPAKLYNVSADGRLAVYDTEGNRSQVFVDDLVAGTSTFLGSSLNAYTAFWPNISGDGRYVTFEAAVSFYAPLEIYRTSLATGAIELVSTSPTGDQGDANSELPSLNRDGTILAFQSRAANLVGGTTFLPQCPFPAGDPNPTYVTCAQIYASAMPLTPTQQLENLWSSVTTQSLGSGSSLSATLQAALNSLASGRTKAACNQLAAFIEEVGAESGTTLTPAQAASLSTSARTVQTSLSC